MTPETGPRAFLRYEDVRTAAAPRETLLAFLQSAYEAGSTAAGWDRILTASASPPPAELAAMRAL